MIKKDKKGKKFFISAQGPYCGHWEDEPETFGSGYNNARGGIPC